MSGLAPLQAAALGAGVGLLAGLVADLPLTRLPDGDTPARLLTARVRRATPESVPFSDVLTVHHVLSVLAGAVAGAVRALFAPAVGAVPATVFAVALVVTAGTVVVAGWLLPGAGVPDRAGVVRRWLVTASAYGGALGVVFAVGVRA